MKNLKPALLIFLAISISCNITNAYDRGPIAYSLEARFPAPWNPCGPEISSERFMNAKIYNKYESSFASLNPVIEQDKITIDCTPNQLGLIRDAINILQADNKTPPLSAIKALITQFHFYGQECSEETTEALCNYFLLPVLKKYPSLFKKEHQNHVALLKILSDFNATLDISGKHKGVGICGAISAFACIGALCDPSPTLITIALAAGSLAVASLSPKVKLGSRPIVRRLEKVLDGDINNFTDLPTF